MNQQPTLETQRLILRPLVLADAPAVQHLAGSREVARMTIAIPHPYEEGMAEQWIATHEEQFLNTKGVHFAVTLREQQALCGVVGLEIDAPNNNAMIGYWLGVPYWGKGYCTEAARAVIGYGFESLGLHRIHSYHFGSNPASGRVMQKLGMEYEGRLREHILKWGDYEDHVQYGLLAAQWKTAQPKS
jgi:RimJ/RimL family protein N-acetyltransferase